ncbi:GAP family protein [Candidatus Saccharibacteria bacterium]|nr:GAP family protein [Candidatus Saccharibacteria bacterium]
MNIVEIVIVFLQLSFFGIFVAFNPMLLVSELLIILRSKRPLLFSLVFIMGASIPLIVIAAIGAAIFKEDTVIRPFGSDIKLSPFLNVLIGVILLLVSVRLFFNGKISTAHKVSKNSANNMSIWALFWFAFFRSALSFTSIIGIVAAAKVIKDYTDNYFVSLLGLFWTILIGMLPFWGLLGYSIKRPESIKVIENKIDPILNINYKNSIRWVLLIAGVFFIFRGLINISN